MVRQTKRPWRTVFFLTALLFAAVLLSGCKSQETFSTKEKSEREYGKGETLVIVTTERLRYEELYSDQIWTAAVDNRGTRFEAVLIGQIHDFLKELKVMSLMAAEQELKLTSREKEQVKEAARQYYEALGGTDASRFGIDEKGLEAFYTDYWLAQKLVEQLTEGVNLEVSDSEAKVITVLEIETDDADAASAAMARLKEEGADFSSVAKDVSSGQEIRKRILRGQHGDEYEEAAFSLETGEISGILRDSGRYYILKCVSDYEEAATRIHKEQMIRQKKNAAFYASYQSYKDGVTLIEDTQLWRKLSVSESQKVTADFFGIFEKVCKEP